MKGLKKKTQLVIISLLAMSFCFTFGFSLAYFTQSGDSSITFTGGKIDFNMTKINSSATSDTITSEDLSSNLAYVSYKDDVIDNKYNALNYMVSYIDIQFNNKSDVDIKLDLTLDFVFESAKERSCIIFAYTEYSNITDNYDYKANLFTFDGVSDATSHKEKMYETYNLSNVDPSTLRVSLFTNETFTIDTSKSYRFVMLLDYDVAKNNDLESDINSFSHNYNFNLVATLSQHHD